MNYLGHLLLSGDDEHLLMGNFMVDRLGLKELTLLDPVYQDGILFHRHIDFLTDSHHYFKETLQILYPVYHKYSAVVLDVFIDYLLASDWDNYSAEPFDDFKKRIYKILDTHAHAMPERSQGTIHFMVDHDFIEQYDDWSGLEMVFRRLDQRTKFPSFFAQQIDFLKQKEAVLRTGFGYFFDDIRSDCLEFLQALDTE